MSKEKPHPILARVGARLRYLRKKKGETMAIHKKIAKSYDVSLSQSSYSKIESGKISIPLPTLYALADYFKVDLNYLLDLPTGAESKKPKDLSLLLKEAEFMDLLEELIQEVGLEYASYYLVSGLQSALELLRKREKFKKLRAAPKIGS